MDLRKLRCFQAVADEGSFSKAAETLHVAQPALSKTIQTLEEALGAQLFIRHSKGVELTEEGVCLLRHATDLLSAWKIAEAEVRERAEEPGGIVSIGAPPTLAQYLFGPLCSAIDQIYPRIKLELFEGVGHHLWRDLHAERLDLAIVGQLSASDSVISELVTHEDVFILSPNSAALPDTMDDLERLQEHPLIVTTRAPTGRSWFEEITRSSPYAFNIRFRVESPQVAKDLVRRDLGVAVLPTSGVISGFDATQFKCSKLLPLKLSRSVACRKTRFLHPSVSACRNILKDLLRSLEAGP